MPLSSLNFSSTASQNWTASTLVTGLQQGNQNNNQINAVTTLGTALANNVVGGSDELMFTLAQPAASGTTTINLRSFTDIVGQTTISLARLKFIRFKLLGSNESSGGVPGTGCTSVTVGNAGSNPNALFLSNTTYTFNLNGGTYGEAVTFESPTANGIAVSSSHENILITNNDAVNPAVVMVTVVGGTT